MNDIATLFLRTFTRYFLPGLIFLIVAIILPTYFIYGQSLLDLMMTLGVPAQLILAIMLGYVLDSLGTYRFTLKYREYIKAKSSLVCEAQKIIKDISSNDPDQYLSDLWVSDENTYNRLLLERAEWVMILETSFAFLIGSVAVFLTWVIKLRSGSLYSYWQPVAALLMAGCSYLTSSKGIQRMHAHDVKMLRAISRNRKLKGGDSSNSGGG